MCALVLIYSASFKLHNIIPAAYAPVMSAMPKYFSATYARAKHKTNPKIGILWVCGFRLSNHLKPLYAKYPPTKATIKNNTVLITIMEGFTEVSLNPMTTVKTIMPMTSSIMAELKMVVPTNPFNFPSYCRAATVILKLVAVMMAKILIPAKKDGVPTPSNP